MIVQAKLEPDTDEEPGWHGQFLRMLPAIVQVASAAFRNLPPEPRDDAVEEVLAYAVVAYQRLVERGKADAATSSSLARFGVRRYHGGRRVGTRTNIRDVLSQHARRMGYQVHYIGTPRDQRGGWQEGLIDTRQMSVLDQVAFRTAFSTWFRKLSSQEQLIVELLAIGQRPRDIAHRLGISPSRVSHVRRKLADSWFRLHSDD